MKKKNSYTAYLDANNSYCLSIKQKPPCRNLEWDDTITEEDIITYMNGSMGYILEVDLEYPKELHDLHSDHPLAPEVMNGKANMLSEKQAEIFKLMEIQNPKMRKTKT